ncbi:MAG: hypothetical protein B9J98_08165 [Candidatus Terraquivivens tikiterensis]|uniref:Ribbon-helix-helix protein CopG domain-containing protein n=1 Tax=Candidatus Terraquivivens tikiterensis TaxID=1980982 RepID=A0A2R7Y0P4_9ARCH|nr:MAG: hypothetical protein B9J98_08165 [Candidatus Terraquivivens tikiterensis]
MIDGEMAQEGREKLSNFSIRLSKSMMEKIDRLIELGLYVKRSEVIRAALIEGLNILAQKYGQLQKGWESIGKEVWEGFEEEEGEEGEE